jgi:hypothetical protein
MRRGALLAALGLLVGLAACGGDRRAELLLKYEVAGDSEDAAKRLERRLGILGDSNQLELDAIAIEASDDGTLQARVTLDLDEPGCAPLAEAASLIEARTIGEATLGFFETHPGHREPLGDDGVPDGFVPPPGARVLRERVTPSDAAEPAASYDRPWVVLEAPILDGSAVASAEAELGEQGWSVLVRFDDVGRATFEAQTRRLVGQTVVIALGDEVLGAPKIMEPIPGGNAQIMLSQVGGGAAARAEAEKLAAKIRAQPIADRARMVGMSGVIVGDARATCALATSR